MLDMYRNVGAGTVLCQLAFLAASLCKGSQNELIRQRSSRMLEHAISRFGAEAMAIMLTAEILITSSSRRDAAARVMARMPTSTGHGCRSEKDMSFLIYLMPLRRCYRDKLGENG